MASIWSLAELDAWLQENYPEITFLEFRNGAIGIMQMIQEKRYQELPIEYDIPSINYFETGLMQIFDIKNRLIGGWICDEIRKRDPKLVRNEGNMYNEMFKESFMAGINKAARDQAWKDSAMAQWDCVRRNEGLMNRIYRHLENGNTHAACEEVSLEKLYKNALIENPAELRRKEFWRA